MVIGTYHFANPGADLTNVKADDVLAPARQREIAAITKALGAFKPTFVGVEQPAAVAEERYAKFLHASQPAARDEVAQLGFRLAKEARLPKVYGLDVAGDFPFDAVQSWAKANGRMASIDQMMASGASLAAKFNAIQEKGTIGDVLRFMNGADAIRANHSFYPRFLLLGNGETQPGVALLSAWYTRNLAICARLLQALRPADRAVVFFGQGHVYLLEQCLNEAPGVERIDALAYLP